jgi:DNA-binding transcriptional regulator YdaS (Cro superfamily)
MDAITHACEVAGSQAALAAAIKVVPATVHQWTTGVRPVPGLRCPEVERHVRGTVTVEQLRPDITWVRVPDPDWPHPDGRPLIDVTARVNEAA